MPSFTEENYLKALYALKNADGEVNLSELSKSLGVSKSTANTMVKKLQDQSWVVYQKYRPLRLTKAGEKKAALVVRKHRITEMYLVKHMGIGWEKVHPIAEEMEHIDSPLLFQRMDEILGHPKFDPHGSPIPDENGLIQENPTQLLSNIDAQQKVNLVGIENSSESLLEFLNQKSIGIGDTIWVEKIIQFDHSREVVIGGKQFQLSKQVCDSLKVK